MSSSACPVNSHNEWDTLEEVIVGNLRHAHFPAWEDINRPTVDEGDYARIQQIVGGAGAPYPAGMIEQAQRELDEFVHILQSEGVIVRQVPDHDFSRPYKTPAWESISGFCAANPRDPFMILGNEILETPMADRGRYFEAWPYRELFKEYFRQGARWTSAPKPQLLDAILDADYRVPRDDEPMRFVVTEFEPVFDAADFVRCGRDIFGQLSNVTNQMGVDWLRRHLGDGYRVHLLQNRSPQAIHIDTTFMPLAPGKVLVNPEYLDISTLPPILQSWDILVAPQPIPHRCPLGMVSHWASMNVLMLDEQRIIVEKRQEPLIKALQGWGFQPIPVHFEHYYPFLGSFHCSTLDVRRSSTLQSYF